METDQPEFFFHIEYLDVVPEARKASSTKDVTLKSPNTASGAIFLENSASPAACTPNFHERGPHSDIFINCTLDSFGYDRNEAERMGISQSSKSRSVEYDTTHNQGETNSSAIDHEQAGVLSTDQSTDVDRKKLEAAAWYLPQPVNYQRAVNTHPWTLQEIAATRQKQNEQLGPVNTILDTWSGSGNNAMGGYYTWKYGISAANDPFVQRWYEAQKGRPSGPETHMEDALVQESSTAIDKGMIEDDEEFLESLPIITIDSGTDLDSAESSEDKAKFESTEMQQAPPTETNSKSAAQRRTQMSGNRLKPPEQALEFGRFGDVVTDSAPSLLYDPESRNTKESSTTKPVADLQSLRRRRHLPKLSTLDTSF
ncbi:MAG: hypothetical protein M1821_009233 [Bathelium mastoideum]|nr:MAG: hypothetical protein M1821_009233 [Bathelium mastoideum]